MRSHDGRKQPMPCRFCGADTRVDGYTYGACNKCTKKALSLYERRSLHA